jgi:hypothetical protein
VQQYKVRLPLAEGQPRTSIESNRDQRREAESNEHRAHGQRLGHGHSVEIEDDVAMIGAGARPRLNVAANLSARILRKGAGLRANGRIRLDRSSLAKRVRKESSFKRDFCHFSNSDGRALASQ